MLGFRVETPIQVEKERKKREKRKRERKRWIVGEMALWGKKKEREEMPSWKEKGLGGEH